MYTVLLYSRSPDRFTLDEDTDLDGHDDEWFQPRKRFRSGPGTTTRLQKLPQPPQRPIIDIQHRRSVGAGM